MALSDELNSEKAPVPPAGMAERLLDIGRRCNAHPVLDDGTDDEILGYDEFGVPR